jgi:hypothetical protein
MPSPTVLVCQLYDQSGPKVASAIAEITEIREDVGRLREMAIEKREMALSELVQALRMAAGNSQ